MRIGMRLGETADVILKWIGDAKFLHTGPGQLTVALAGRGDFSEISDDWNEKEEEDRTGSPR